MIPCFWFAAPLAALRISFPLRLINRVHQLLIFQQTVDQTRIGVLVSSFSTVRSQGGELKLRKPQQEDRRLAQDHQGVQPLRRQGRRGRGRCVLLPRSLVTVPNRDVGSESHTPLPVASHFVFAALSVSQLW